MSITSVTPTPAPGTITLGGFLPAASTGGTATANVDVDAAVPRGAYSVVVGATNNDADPQTGSCTLNVWVVGSAAIHDIQGAAHISPLAGEPVETEGIVTARRQRLLPAGSEPRRDDATSEGIFAFTGGAPTVAVGDAVEVTGLVSEFRPGGSAQPNLTTTELVSPTTIVLSSGNPLPGPQVVGAGGRSRAVDGDRGRRRRQRRDRRSLRSGHRRDRLLREPRGHAGRSRRTPSPLGRRTASGKSACYRTTARGERAHASRRHRRARRTTSTRSGSFSTTSLPARVPLVDTRRPLHQPTSLGVLDYSFGNFKLLVTSAPTARSERRRSRSDRAAGRSGDRRRDIQRREPRARRSAVEVRRARRHLRRQPPVAGHRQRRGGTGQQRYDQQRRHGRVDHLEHAHRRDPGGGWAALRVSPDRPRQQRGRWRAGRQHPRRLPLPDRPRGRVHRPARRRPDDGDDGNRPPVRAAALIEPWPRRPRRSGLVDARGCPQAVGWRVHGRRARSSSLLPTTGSRRAATNRCSAASSRRCSSPRHSELPRPSSSRTSSTTSSRRIRSRMSSSSATSTTSSSPRR